jgi:hypothetical protein
LKKQTIRITEFCKYFAYSKDDDKVYLPNEIFNDFQSSLFKTNMHRAFGYSFYYLCSYIYRNVKFKKVHLAKNLYSQNLLAILGANQSKLNYITKRLGVLDEIGYTLSINDYPMDFIQDINGLVDFEMASECNEELRKYLKYPPSFVCKYPKLGFYRQDGDTEYTGTFFYFENTHTIEFPVFAKCMCESKDSYELFYLYGFLKAYEGYINSKDVYIEYVRVSLGFSNVKIKRLLSHLVKIGLLQLNHNRMLRYSILV